MMRTIFIIPRMFTEDELFKINPALPEDFEQRSKEFSDYVEEKFEHKGKCRGYTLIG
ncbi:MAG TPA: hypothetical protein VFF30_04720 [Nitrososphaerales archaeon]|nr:hypothetical protein [Nitrososphaerales archaeon]